jgi:hypothetical protein
LEELEIPGETGEAIAESIAEPLLKGLQLHVATLSGEVPVVATDTHPAIRVFPARNVTVAGIFTVAVTVLFALKIADVGFPDIASDVIVGATVLYRITKTPEPPAPPFRNVLPATLAPPPPLPVFAAPEAPSMLIVLS